MKVSVIMGSASDWDVMSPCCATLEQFGIPYEKRVLSAHRNPGPLAEYVTSLQDKGCQIVIAGAGGAAHLPGVIAALTTLPVIGIPVKSKALMGMDSLLSIVQMPSGIPVFCSGMCSVSGVKAQNACSRKVKHIGKKCKAQAKNGSLIAKFIKTRTPMTV